MSRIDRRTFVRQSLTGTAAAFASTATLFGRGPAIVQSETSLPSMPYGISAGAAGPDRFVVWSRSDRPARMLVEYATTEGFTDTRRISGPAALEGTDFTARTVLAGLPRGQRIFYRVTFQDLTDLRRISRPETGSFVTAPTTAGSGDVTIAWSADTVGQGWGINPEWGGLRLYETMLKAQPDLFINSGDTIYADQPVVAEVK